MRLSCLSICCVASTPGNVESGFTVLGGYFPGKVPVVIVRRVEPTATFPATVKVPSAVDRVVFTVGLATPPPCAASFPGKGGTGPTGLGRYGPVNVPVVRVRRERPTGARSGPLGGPPRVGRDVFPGVLVSVVLLCLSVCSVRFLRCVGVYLILGRRGLFCLPYVGILGTYGLLTVACTHFSG